jgi:hypothetical protein
LANLRALKWRSMIYTFPRPLHPVVRAGIGRHRPNGRLLSLTEARTFRIFGVRGRPD